MLVLSREAGEEVVLTLPDGRTVRVLVTPVESGTVRLGFDAPADVVIHRAEVRERIEQEGSSRPEPSERSRPSEGGQTWR